MKDGIYNQQVYIPKLKFRDVEHVVRYSFHSLEAANNDRYGVIDLPDAINLARVELVEMEVIGGKIHKVVVRMPYSVTLDLVMVVLLETLTVKTVWLNKRSDNHRTLKDVSKFVQKPKRS